MSKTDKKPEKNKFQMWVEFIPFWCLYHIIRMMNLRVAYFLSRQLFKVLYVIDRRHRVRSIQHLLHAGVARTPHEARHMAHKAYLNFSMLLVEIFKFDQLVKPGMVGVVGDPETIRAACKPEGNNCNVIVVTAHYGNWELAGSCWAQQFRIPMVSVFRRFGNPLIGKYILGSRESKWHQSVPKEGGIKGMLRALREGKTIAILADQHAKTKEGVENVFFGQPCRTHTSPALLHLKTGVPIVPELTRRCGNGFNFEFVVGEMIRYTPTGDKEKDVQTVAQMYTSALEKLIREEPEQWMWAHRRWLNINRKSSAASSSRAA
ncbi:MAG: lysophospholipid acyltransferase family protein [Victivallales bacterium]|nr:lysophospholipid acyltransferase family protein [Victivallales bacterium]